MQEQPITRAEFNELKKRLDQLEKQERRFDFDIRDIAHKTTIALGILTAQESDIKDIKSALETQDKKLDQILDRLPPKS